MSKPFATQHSEWPFSQDLGADSMATRRGGVGILSLNQVGLH